MTVDVSGSIDVSGTTYEYSAEAEAGFSLSDGAKWWGTRVKYRRVGIADRRWTNFLLVDVHPFDGDTIRHAVSEFVQGRMTAHV